MLDSAGKEYICFDILTMTHMALLLAFGIAVHREVLIYHLSISGGALIIPFCFGISYLFCRLYGLKEYYKLILNSMLGLLIFALLTYVLIVIPSNTLGNNARVYLKIFGNIITLYSLFGAAYSLLSITANQILKLSTNLLLSLLTHIIALCIFLAILELFLRQTNILQLILPTLILTASFLLIPPLTKIVKPITGKSSNEETPQKSKKTKPVSRNQFKYLSFLYIVYITIFLSSITMVYKGFKIDCLILSDATLFFPITYLIGDVIAEVYGYKIARRLIWLSLMSEFIFATALTLLLYSPHPSTWHLGKYYLNTEGKLLRIFAANSLATFIGDMLNIYVLSKWKMLLHGRMFWLRSIGSTAVGEAAYTIIASTLGFIGLMPLHKVIIVVASTYLLKALYAILFVYFGVLAANYLKSKEKINIYDYNTNFNPFKFEVSDMHSE